MPSEVPYNESLQNSNYYGNGIIVQQSVNLDTPIMEGHRGVVCDKQPIKYDEKEKVNKNVNNNFKKFMNDSVDKYNYEDRMEENIDRGLDFLQMAENQNLDFDGDGVPDIDLSDMYLPIDSKAVSVEKIDNTVKEEEKPVVQPMIEQDAVAKFNHMPEPKKYEVPKSEVKTVTANASDQAIKTSDMVTMGVGALALVSMFLGR